MAWFQRMAVQWARESGGDSQASLHTARFNFCGGFLAEIGLGFLGDAEGKRRKLVSHFCEVGDGEHGAEMPDFACVVMGI